MNRNRLRRKTMCLPPDMSSSQRSMLDMLRGLNYQDFAKQYLDDQLSAHTKLSDAKSLFAVSRDSPKLLKAAQRHHCGAQIRVRDRELVEHLGVALMHRI
jgi:predicted outer membrane protein